LFLAHVTVQLAGFHTAKRKDHPHFMRFLLLSEEDDDAFGVDLFANIHEICKSLVLLALPQSDELLRKTRDCVFLRVDHEAHWLVHTDANELVDRACHRSGEQHRLSRLGNGSQNLVQLAFESLLEHAISLVEYQNLQMLDLEGGSVVHVVDETTWSSNDYVGPCLEHCFLLARRKTTSEEGKCDIGEGSKLRCDVETLDGQLTCRHEDGHARGWYFLGPVQETFEDRNEEGGCFTRTSLSTTDDVLALHGDGNGFGLDRCRFSESDGRKTLLNGTRKRHRVK
jgi:hypothetical protein